MRSYGQWLYRLRYLLLAAWATGWAWRSFNHSHGANGLSDWDRLRYGGRAMLGIEHFYTASPLHIYAAHPELQIGPPALLVNGVTQRIFTPSETGYAGDIAVMTLMLIAGLLCVWVFEHLAAQWQPARTVPVLLTSVIFVAAWAYSLGSYGHLDDAMAVTGVMLAALAVARYGWWQAGLALGLAAACKPWAIIAIPILLALPVGRARAAMTAAVVSVLPWLPFFFSTTDTLRAFRMHWLVVPGSALHALGVPAWHYTAGSLREVQFLLAAGLAALVARRQWPAALMAAMAVKVLFEPAAYSYYGLGPLAGAALLDVSRNRRVPVWTLCTALVEFALPVVLSSDAAGMLRLAGSMAAIAVLLLPAIHQHRHRRPAAAPDPSVLVAAPS